MCFSLQPEIMSGCRVFIGRLSPHARERDVEKFFKGYGRIREINLKNGFGFVVSMTDHSMCVINLDHVQPFTFTESPFSLLRSLMTTEMRMMLCTSWMAKNCVMKGTVLISGLFVIEHSMFLQAEWTCWNFHIALFTDLKPTGPGTCLSWLRSNLIFVSAPTVTH